MTHLSKILLFIFLLCALVPLHVDGAIAALVQQDSVAAGRPGGVHWGINWWYYPAGLLLLALALVFSLRRRHLRRKGEQEKDI